MRLGSLGVSGWLNLALKTLLIALLAYSLSMPELPRFAGKAMPARALTYPLIALIVPLVWWWRGRGSRYPHLVDALVVLPFVIDTGGNVLDLYAVVHFDDLAHLVNWAILVSAVGAAVARLRIARWNAAALAVGFGAASMVFWELAEYAVLWLGSSGLQLTYRDTIGDMALASCGTLAGGLLVATLVWPRGRARDD